MLAESLLWSNTLEIGQQCTEAMFFSTFPTCGTLEGKLFLVPMAQISKVQANRKGTQSSKLWWEPSC